MSASERWVDAAVTHSRVLVGLSDRCERMRMLASSPMFSLWVEVKRELEEAADEISSLRGNVARLEARVRALEGEDA